MGKQSWVRWFWMALLVLGMGLSSIACDDDDDDDDTVNDDDDTQPNDDDTGSECDEGWELIDGECQPFYAKLSSNDDKTVPLPGLQDEVTIVIDEWGVPHIFATNPLDMNMATGFMHAKDRLLQMDLIRKSAKGTLGEVVYVFFGDDALEDDYRTRRKGFWRASKKLWDTLDDDLKANLQAYADGVNQTVLAMGDPGKAAEYGLSFDFIYSFLNITPDTWKPWSPVDSLSFGRYMSAELSYDETDDLRDWRRMQNFLAAFPEGDPRHGLAAESIRPTSNFPTSIIDGFPEGDTVARRLPVARDYLPNLQIDDWGMVDRAIAGSERLLNVGDFFGNQIDGFIRGSNNWIVSGEHTDTGRPILANDPHLSLDYPPTFYEIHLNTKLRDPDGTFNVIGINFAAAPGVVIGMNDHLAWGVTTASFDVTDNYIEQLTPGSGPDDPGTVLFQGEQVPIVREYEDFHYVEDGEQKTQTRSIDYVTTHLADGSPLLEISEDGTEGVSVVYTGQMPSNELLAFWELNQATNQEEANAAYDNFKVGAQSMVSIYDSGDIYFTANSWIPIRDNVDHETPPWLPMPGTGDYEWIGYVPDNKVPHALNDPKGFTVTANNDQTGFNWTDPLSGEYYVQNQIDEGFRADRITELLQAEVDGDGVSFADMVRIQNDFRSNWGPRLVPHLLDASETNPELFADADMADAIDRLAEWAEDGYWAWSGFEDDAGAHEQRMSVATTIFNLWATRFLHETLDDEFNAAGEGANRMELVDKLLNTPERVDLDMILFDDLDTPQTETMADIAARALRDGLDWGAQNEDLGTDVDEWLWGKIHTITFEFLVPLDETQGLNVPATGDGFPRPSDNDSVDVASHGDNPNRFTYGGGPNMRMVATYDEDGQMHGINHIPGGQSGITSSPHYGDQAQMWVNNERHPMAFTPALIEEHFESKITLVPAP